MFLQVCVILFTGGRGACVVVGGVCGCEGACMVEGMRGGRGACAGYDERRSMSGRYASYWNAFLFILVFIRRFLEATEAARS